MKRKFINALLGGLIGAGLSIAVILLAGQLLRSQGYLLDTMCPGGDLLIYLGIWVVLVPTAMLTGIVIGARRRLDEEQGFK